MAPPAELLKLGRCVCVRVLVTLGLTLTAPTGVVTTERRTQHAC
ncbi:hypothetical protein HMPREF9566_01132 [Cutibacterium acnes HL045PA1]|nr:hypothetical protein HMPREF9585_00081 [Cutibacterium acnes HL083PA1]EFS68820.1 hypothetical protein HMPREF9616_01404 [Cutibacterium acnes HL007PA1]EFT21036.1 hypothetical protein HMPREF9566_01132 [Cutibacterium acnes HL045PA1]